MKLLLPPGIGDLHWMMLRMESFEERHGTPDVWVCTNGSKDRAGEYLDRLAFVNFQGYYNINKFRTEFRRVFVEGKRLDRWNGFDQFVGVNHDVERGLRPDNWSFGYATNYDYEVRYDDEDREWGLALCDHPYILLSFYQHGWYGEWWKKFPPEYIVQELRKTFPDHKLVATGAGWDSKHGLQVDVDMCGKTTIGQLFEMIRNADAFVGHAAGNAMMAVHFMTPTVMLWGKNKFKWEMATCWADPDASHYVPWDLMVNKDLEAMGRVLKERVG